MWAAAPQRGLHSARICFRHTDIRETLADAKPCSLYYSNAETRFCAFLFSLTPFSLFCVFVLHISKLKSPFIAEGNVWFLGR